MNEDRILDKLEGIESQNRDMLVGLTRLQEQMRDMPELKMRVSALEKFKWVAMGALAAGGTSLGAQIMRAVS